MSHPAMVPGLGQITYDTSEYFVYQKVCSYVFDALSTQRLHEDALKVSEEVFFNDGRVDSSELPIQVHLPKRGTITPGNGIICRAYANTSLSDSYPAIIALYYSLGVDDLNSWIVGVGELICSVCRTLGLASEFVEGEDYSVKILASADGKMFFELGKFTIINAKGSLIAQFMVDKVALRELSVCQHILPSFIADPLLMVVCGRNCLCPEICSISQVTTGRSVRKVHAQPADDSIHVPELGCPLLLFKNDYQTMSLLVRRTGRLVTYPTMADCRLEEVLSESDNNITPPNVRKICADCAVKEKTDTVLLFKLFDQMKCNGCNLVVDAPILLLPSTTFSPAKC